MPLSDHAKSTILAYKFVKLHTGDPGPGCTDNPATDTRRMAAAFGADGVSTADLEWPLAPAGETITHVSSWNDPVAGDPWSGTPLATPDTVAATQLFAIRAGKLRVNFPS